MAEGLEMLTIPEEKLENLEVGELRRFSFEKGTEIPIIAYLINTSHQLRGVGERKEKIFASGKIIATYKITAVY